MIVTVKIKPWLKEFLMCRFGDPVQANSKNFPGIIISPLVEYTPDDYTPERYPPTESLDIEIPRDLAINAPRSDSGNIYISKDNQVRFEKGVAVIFKDEFFYYLDDKIRYLSKERIRSSNMKDSIYQFCIDNKVRFNSLTYENLKKMYYRYRKNREKSPKRLSKAFPRSSLIF